ncbi:MAG TPA: hypothetical protein VGP93_00035, partial [Polyangiaceae bacterium]|nr:hypothetical protein [Polyangiaceae bacterium]
MRQPLVGTGSFALSLLAHAGLMVVGAALFAGTLSRRADSAKQVEVSLQGSELELPSAVVAPRGHGPTPEIVEPAAGGDRPARPDLSERGRGGSKSSPQALNLSSSQDGITLVRGPPNRLRDDQLQRSRDSSLRRTLDDRRALPQPQELALLSVGESGGRFRTAGESPGPRAALEVAERSGRSGEPPWPLPWDNAALRELENGSERDALGSAPAQGRSGISGGTVLAARPWALRSRESSPAAVRGKPTDNSDSDEEIATRVAS